MIPTTAVRPRYYPPIGEIPMPLEGDHVISCRSEKAILLLSAVHASESGVRAQLQVAVLTSTLRGAVYSFSRVTTEEQTQLDVWARFESKSNNLEVPASLQRSHAARHEGIYSGSYYLYFPYDLRPPQTGISLRLVWPESGIGQHALVLPTSDLRDAITRSVSAS